jgi:aspartate aminotransferase
MDKLLSNRVKLLSVSVTIGISKKSKELTSKGLNIINLAIGESYFKTPKYIQNFTKFSIDLEKYFFYSPVPGYVDLRIAISKKIKRDNKLFYKYNHIIVSNGAKQAIANVFLSLINFGDDVLIYLPCWPTYIDLVKLLGGNTVFVKGNIKKNFKVSIYQLYKSITKKTKIIIFSSPCNPTGSVLSKYEVIETSKVLKNSNIIVISDEIYEYVNFIGRNISISSILFMRNYAVIINGFSKGFSMTG